jgi:hydrogenase maturation protease
VLLPGEVRVLGLGNVLMGDDALGPWVVEELLAKWEFPDGVAVLDVGTPGLDLTPYLADAGTVLLVDTVKADGPPGAIRIYSRAQILSRPPQPRVSPHDPGLTEALLALDFAGGAPRDIVLVGVVPGVVAKGIGLTPAVKDAVGRAAAEIVRLLSGLGLSPRRKTSASPASPWWEKPAATPSAA